MRGILATLRPFQWNAESVADFRRCAVGRDFDPKLFADFACLANRTLAATWTSRRPLEDGIDQCASQRLVRELIAKQVELQEAHRTLDVHADRAGIDVRGR